MKILLVHNQYQTYGGEDTVVHAEFMLLQKFGHEVKQYIVSNDAIGGVVDRIKVACSTHYSHTSKKQFAQELDEFQPSIVHVHNFFPLLTPSIYGACNERNIPVIQTLHNFRTICPGGLLYRDNQVCEKCINGNAYQAVLHGCYRGSKLGTMIVAHMVNYHRNHSTWQHDVDAFIALTNFSKNKFIEGGFPAKKINVKPNFLPDITPAPVKEKRLTPYFIGRLSHEKGIQFIADAWQDIHLPLRVVGDGPLRNMIKAGASIECLGSVPHAQVAEHLRQASFLVMASQCYENFPMVIVEALRAGVPVLAPRLGSITEIIEDGKVGLLYGLNDKNDFLKKVEILSNDVALRDDLANQARQAYLEKYNDTVNYEILINIYKYCIEQRQQYEEI